MFYVNGTLQTQLTPDELAAQFTAFGLAAELRESQHYSTGVYVRLRHADAHIALESVGPDEYILRADADSHPVLIAVCDRLSRHFLAAGIPYRLEIYDEGDELLNQYPPAL